MPMQTHAAHLPIFQSLHVWLRRVVHIGPTNGRPGDADTWQSALEANKLGNQVGVRINIDVLNSQSQLFQTKRDLTKARYDVLLGQLKLRQAAGVLKAEDVKSIDYLLQK
jgi:hypothetical protein